MKVNEIFLSHQGEGTRAGEPCIFIRLAGCNLRCSYCDTKYAYDEGRNISSFSKLIKEIRKKLIFPGCHICITGGEPLLQKKELKELIDRCRNEFKEELGDWRYDGINNIIVETNGSILLPKNWCCEWVMDWKLPSSGMNDKMEYVNLERLDCRDELKFVIQDRKDYEEAKRIIKKYDISATILFSPVYGKLELKDLWEWKLKDKLPGKIQVQLHKIAYPPDMRGV